MDFSSRFLIDKKKVAHRIINNEAVILNLENGVFFSLNETSTLIWQGIADGKSPEQIFSLLSAKYAMTSPKKLRGDLIEFIRDLKNENLIQKK